MLYTKKNSLKKYLSQPFNSLDQNYLQLFEEKNQTSGPQA